jgi:hypothetical protein
LVEGGVVDAGVGGDAFGVSSSGALLGDPPVGIVGDNLLGDYAADGAVDTTAAENETVIGKVKDLAPENLRDGESSLLDRLPDQGNPQANWQQNSGVLRQEMGKGLPIRDASVDSAGNLANNNGFLRAERGLLQDRGWTYDPKTTMWNPPPTAK